MSLSTFDTLLSSVEVALPGSHTDDVTYMIQGVQELWFTSGLVHAEWHIQRVIKNIGSEVGQDSSSDCRKHIQDVFGKV